MKNSTATSSCIPNSIRAKKQYKIALSNLTCKRTFSHGIDESKKLRQFVVLKSDKIKMEKRKIAF